MDINIKIALISFIGTLIGALVSCGTTFFVELKKCNLEEKLYYKRKKEETYIEMQDFLTELNTHWHELKVHNISNTIRIAYNSLRSKAHIYAKKEIADLFYGLANDLMTGVREDKDYQKRNDKLINMIKKI